MNNGDAFSIGKLIWSTGKALATGSIAGIGSVAWGTTMLVKKYVDGKNNEILDHVQKAEGCAYIELVECTFGVPDSYAISQVAEHGGITWRRPDVGGPLVFWHPDETFRPSLGNDPRIKNVKTGLVVRASYSGPSKVCEKTEKCCRKSRG